MTMSVSVISPPSISSGGKSFRVASESGKYLHDSSETGSIFVKSIDVKGPSKGPSGQYLNTPVSGGAWSADDEKAYGDANHDGRVDQVELKIEVFLASEAAKDDGMPIYTTYDEGTAGSYTNSLPMIKDGQSIIIERSRVPDDEK